MSGVPVSKIVHVSSRVHWRAFGGHADVPQGAGRRGGRRRRGEVVSLRSTGPVLHDLLVFGSFVLEPYFHLEGEGKREVLDEKLIHTTVWFSNVFNVQLMHLIKSFSTQWEKMLKICVTLDIALQNCHHLCFNFDSK